MRYVRTSLRIFAVLGCLALVAVALAREGARSGVDAAEPTGTLVLHPPAYDYDITLPRETLCATVTDGNLAPVDGAVVDWDLSGPGSLDLVTSVTDEFGQTCNRYDFPVPPEDAPFSITAFSSVGGVIVDDTAYFSAPGPVTYSETQDNFCYDNLTSYDCFSRNVAFDVSIVVGQLGADEWAVAATGPYNALYTTSFTYPDFHCGGIDERSGSIAGPQYMRSFGDLGEVAVSTAATYDYHREGTCVSGSEDGTEQSWTGLSGAIVPDADGNAIAIDFTRESYDPAEEVTITTTGRVELAAPPIIFLHGFLGSRILCGAEELWPNIPGSPRLLEMRLADDGITNLPGATSGCAPEVGPLLDSVLGSDIYGTTEDFLTGLAGGSAYFFTWDWRTSPEQSIERLDDFIDNVRSTRAGQKVVIMAHSYGGLLTRLYIDETARAEKVARVLTLGTPAWGAPKALFPLYAGIEAPDFSTLDILIDNEDMKAFAVNLFGNYNLLPSASYGPWLQVYPDPDPLSPAEVLDAVASIGGNPALLASAQATHAAVLDSVGPGSVPFEVIVGTGLPTIAGVSVRYDERLQIRYANGDGTVPAISGARGPADATNANAAHTHYTCGISHVPLPGHPTVVDAVSDYLMIGAPIHGLSASPCAFEGLEFKLYDLPPLEGATAMMTSSSGAALAASVGAISAEDADAAHLADYLDLPNERIFVTGRAFPDIALPPGGMLDVSDILADGTTGPATTYGPLSGEVVISSGLDGVVVYEDGEVVEPNDATPSPTLSATATPTQTATHTPTAVNTATHTPTATPTYTPTQTATHTPTAVDAATHTPTSTPTQPATSTATATNTAAPATTTPTATATPNDETCADVTGDQRVTVRDVIAIARAIASRRQQARFDVNHDGRVSALDVLVAIRQLGQRCSQAGS